MKLPGFLQRTRTPIKHVDSRKFLSPQEVRWLSFFMGVIIASALAILYIDSISLSAMAYHAEFWVLNSPDMSRAALFVLGGFFLMLAPFILPLVIYVGPDSKLKVSVYKYPQQLDDIYIFHLLWGKKILVHQDRVYHRFPMLYAIVGGYKLYAQDEAYVLEGSEFEISKRMDYMKKIEWLEADVSFWKTKYALLVDQQQRRDKE